MAIVTRAGKGSRLTYAELDNNFTELAAQTVDIYTDGTTITGSATLASPLSATQETGTTLRSKLGVTTLSGSNTGDQDLSGYATKTGSETLTNKTITSPVISTITNTGTLTLPTSTGTLALTSQITGTNSGTNTGDETTATIKTKLGVTTLSGSNTGDETVTSVGALINGSTAKTTPVDADFVGVMDSAASNVLKKLSWANVKATLKTYFDTLYPAEVKAASTDLNTGTDDVKFATSLGLESSKYLNQSGSKISATASGTDTYTATIAPAITSYSSGQRFFITFTNANTGAATVNLNSLGAKSIKKNSGVALASGDIAAGQVFLLAYDGTNFQIVGNSLQDLSSYATNATAKAEVLAISCSDLTTALTTGTSKAYFRMPWAGTLTGVRLGVLTAPTGSTIIVNVKEAGTTVFSTKPSIAISSKTSVGGTAAVISDTSLADDAEITIDIDQIGSTVAGAGLIVYLYITRP